MKNNFFNIKPVHALALLISKRSDLLLSLTQRDLLDRFQGQLLGKLWLFLHPLVFILIYSAIFIFFFKMRGSVDTNVKFQEGYEIFLLSGLIPWLFAQDTLGRSCVTISSNTSLVKQVVFPIELLPVKSVLTAIVPFSFSMLILLLLKFILYQTFSFYILLLPLLIILQTLFLLGVSYLLSILGIVFKDIKDFVQLFSFVGVYMTPIFYEVSMLPLPFRNLIYLNPFSYIILCYKDVLYYSTITSWEVWLVTVLGCLLTFILGVNAFRFTKGAIINVM